MPTGSSSPSRSFWKSPPSLLRAAGSPGFIYLLFSAVLILSQARLFYGSMHAQTEHVSLWFAPSSFDEVTQGARAPIWSAPLDDVFIHYDFARSTARGAPFNWVDGNGYSSGGTSLLYPFVLAAGYLLGFRGLALGIWAGIIACVGTFATLWAARRLFYRLPPWLSLLAPLFFLSTGVLNWTLFSGMEVAVFLAIWGLCFVLWDEFCEHIEEQRAKRSHALGLGLACTFLVAGRPEAALLVAGFGLSVAWLFAKQRRFQSALLALVFIGVPGACVILGHSVANKILTGDSSAAGALAKLELHHPYLTAQQVWDAWLFHIQYQVRRISEYHFSYVPGLGYIVWLFALLSLFFQKTRRYGVLLWSSLILWILVTALNGQVRWQNERYVMPAAAWLLLAAALGIAGSLAWAAERGRSHRSAWAALVPLGLAVFAFFVGQAPRFREQVWFFGRASRNILEQHVRTGDYLRRGFSPPPKRVLLSDAGAIPYASDLPAFDLIGLGGYRGLPIAPASRQGVGAAVELIEHLPASARPDIMALYPSWWGNFVLWFGKPLHQFPVRGNVICGGMSKVVYAPDWTPLEQTGQPFSLLPGDQVVDSIDLADLLSERAHGLTWDRPASGYVDMKMLPDPRQRDRDLWDAGRLLSAGMNLQFQSQELSAPPTHLLLRVAPFRNARFSLQADEHSPQEVQLQAGDHWQEIRVELPALSHSAQFSLRVLEGDFHLYHVFVIHHTQKPQAQE